ncbi:nuclear transport factor 2 family protein [Mycolicibacterium sp. S2-37]|uniref:nuclear transport factor 2 family protein n=1 Tax=Mycolicibacterium sp. S2-37 TaxID=2810297 RepID=UPI001A948CF8|nr:nuclear transport factor 2 family protein [Mycolicibacterium sp. S2-37]MBO0679044.1 nuclear transport factor 2 family protein [Mycolicibacterium sp. S2-37]
MTDDNEQNTPFERLPQVVQAYLTTHQSGDDAAALETFTADAVVIDEGHTYRGTQEIADWMGKAAGEYTYTTDFVGATTTDAASVDVLQHLEGDFPGGEADLHFRFSLDGALIARLVIEP